MTVFSHVPNGFSFVEPPSAVVLDLYAKEGVMCFLVVVCGK